jgi:hypothetical protein
VEWGVSPRTVEGYVSRARARLVQQVGDGKEQLRGDAFAFYKGIVENQAESTIVRLRAQERIDQLCGLNAPTKLSVTDPTGTGPGTINVGSVRSLPDEALAKLAAAYDVLEQSNASKPS